MVIYLKNSSDFQTDPPNTLSKRLRSFDRFLISKRLRSINTMDDIFINWKSLLLDLRFLKDVLELSSEKFTSGSRVNSRWQIKLRFGFV